MPEADAPDEGDAGVVGAGVRWVGVVDDVAPDDGVSDADVPGPGVPGAGALDDGVLGGAEVLRPAPQAAVMTANAISAGMPGTPRMTEVSSFSHLREPCGTRGRALWDGCTAIRVRSVRSVPRVSVEGGYTTTCRCVSEHFRRCAGAAAQYCRRQTVL